MSFPKTLAFTASFFLSIENLANFLGLKHRYMPPRSRRQFKNECGTKGSGFTEIELRLPQVQWLLTGMRRTTVARCV